MVKRRKTITEEIHSDLETSRRLEADARFNRLQAELNEFKSLYKSALNTAEAERERADDIADLASIQAREIPKLEKLKKEKHQGTAILALSDWHVEQRVDPNTVNNLNDFSLAIADKRITELTNRFLSELESERKRSHISRVVVWLGGDFISGHIHDDNIETSTLPPLAAMRWASERIRGVLNRISENADSVIVTTSPGNHSRTTKKMRVDTEFDHNYEYNSYLTMAQYENRANIVWQVTKDYLNILDLGNFRIRFHHGHAIQYQGGIGGIHVPASRAHAQWDRTDKVDLSIFGHWHQFNWLYGSGYISNGSMIGHTPYGIKIRAVYEDPSQTMVILDHNRNQVIRAYRIFCNKDLIERKLIGV